MSDKDPGAFRIISEVADDIDVPQHVLRYWETRFPQIKPMKRAGGRRYYRPEDIALVRAIRALLYDRGFTIKGVQRILKEQGVRGVMADDDAAMGEGIAVSAQPKPVAKAVQSPLPGMENDSLDEKPAREPVFARAQETRLALIEIMAGLAECRRLLAVARG